MSATEKPLFQRPIEITSSINGLSVGDSGSGLVDITINAGVYSSFTALMYAWEVAIDAQISGAGGGSTVGWNFTSGALKMQVQFTTGSARRIGTHSSATQANQRRVLDLMGVDWVAVDAGNHSIWEMSHDPWQAGTSRYQWKADSLTARVGDYIPLYVWIPKQQNAIQASWQVKYRELYAGAQSKVGTLGGIETGPEIHYRAVEFFAEDAANVLKTHATDEFLVTRTLQHFVIHSRSSAPTVKGNPATAGFWFTPDIGDRNEIPGDTDGATTDNIGINHDFTTTAQGETVTPDYHTFAQFEVRGPRDARPTSPSGLQFWTHGWEMHEVQEIPTFEAPDQVS